MPRARRTASTGPAGLDQRLGGGQRVGPSACSSVARSNASAARGHARARHARSPLPAPIRAGMGLGRRSRARFAGIGSASAIGGVRDRAPRGPGSKLELRREVRRPRHRPMARSEASAPASSARPAQTSDCATASLRLPTCVRRNAAPRHANAPPAPVAEPGMQHDRLCEARKLPRPAHRCLPGAGPRRCPGAAASSCSIIGSNSPARAGCAAAQSSNRSPSVKKKSGELRPSRQLGLRQRQRLLEAAHNSSE